MTRKAAHNSTYKKLAVQWLNLPTGRQVKLCASYQVLCWQTVFASEIASFLKWQTVSGKAIVTDKKLYLNVTKNNFNRLMNIEI